MRSLPALRHIKWWVYLPVLPFLVALIFLGDYRWIAFPIIYLLGFVGWHHPKVLLSLLWISIPLSVTFTFSDRLGTDLPDEPLMLGVSLLAIFHLVFRGRPFTSRIWYHPLFFFFMVWMVWMAVSTLFSSTPLLSWKFMLAKCWYAGAFFLAPLIWLRGADRIAHFLRCLFIPLFILILITLARHGIVGFRFSAVSEVVQPYFRNHVVYSSMAMVLVPVLFFRLPFSRKKVLAVILIGTVLAALFFSYARGAWLALLVGFFAYLLMRKKLLVHAYLLFWLLLMLVFLWLKQNDRYLRFAPEYRTTIFHSEFSDHWQATYQGKDVSTAERFYRWIAGARMVEDRPWTGFGPSSFYTQYRRFTVPAYQTWVSDNPERSTVHNYFLLTAAEQGIPGFFFFLLLFGAILFYAERLYHRQSDLFSKQLAGGIGVVAVMLGVVNFWSDLIETDKIGSLFFLSISLLLVLDLDRSGRSDIKGIA